MTRKIYLKTTEYLTIPIIYLILGLAWIGLSDYILFEVSNYYAFSKERLLLISNWKGFVYILVTTVLLYILIKNRTKSLVSVRNDFERFFDENPSPMWIYDSLTFDIMLVNNAACEEYEYSKEEFLQLNLFDIKPKTEHEKLAIMLEAQTEEYTDNGEWIHQSKSGEKFYTNVYSHNTFYEEKAACIVTAINIDQRVRAEIEQQNVRRSLDSVALVSITNLQGYILEANEKFCVVSKYKKEELIDQYHNIVNSGYHSQEFWNDMWRTISADKPWRADIKNRAKGGSFYWVDTVINPVYDAEGNVYEYMSVRYDITERKKLEETQQKLLDDFADYAFQTSHNLRGPLARMLGLISIFDGYEDKSFIIDKLKETSIELDVVIKEMNETLDRNSQEILIEKREAKNKKPTE